MNQVFQIKISDLLTIYWPDNWQFQCIRTWAKMYQFNNSVCYDCVSHSTLLQQSNNPDIVITLQYVPCPEQSNAITIIVLWHSPLSKIKTYVQTNLFLISLKVITLQESTFPYVDTTYTVLPPSDTHTLSLHLLYYLFECLRLSLCSLSSKTL